MKKLIYLLTIISSVFFFSSCQKANDNNDEGGVDNVFVGEWERYRREIHDTQNGGVDIETDKWNYTFSKDGSYILSDGFSSPERGNWIYDEAAKTLVIGKKNI